MFRFSRKDEIEGGKIEMKDFCIVVAGEAGQGIQTVENLLPLILKRSGFHVFSYKEYMSRVRGGSNSTLIRVSEEPGSAFRRSIDLLVLLSDDIKHAERLASRLSNQSVILANEAIPLPEACCQAPLLTWPITDLAIKAGHKIYANTVACGIICGLVGVSLPVSRQVVEEYFASKEEKIRGQNSLAFELGYEYAEQNKQLFPLRIALSPKEDVKARFLLSGAEAVALGALAGGCNFISSYPMSPSTGVLVSLASYSRHFDLVVEQAEDEISAVNMALGAWYAGARAMVTTSGGGFALMVEALSLAGMVESPLVVHLGQRPGPATGLPTRTEQADLFFSLYSGHGEFPRVILAPGNIEQAFYLTHRAFYLADKYQVPVIILTDQYLLDSLKDVAALEFPEKIEDFFAPTEADYLKYKITPSGLSPRGIPGLGRGFVCLDSDEHDESGRIIEDPLLREKMVQKRLAKGKLVKKEALPPELIGQDDARFLVLSFGPTRDVIAEAIANLPSVALLHYAQLAPFLPPPSQLLSRARRIIVVEGNATGQLRQLLRAEAGLGSAIPLIPLNKYDGLPFSVEEVREALKKIIEEESHA